MLQVNDLYVNYKRDNNKAYVIQNLSMKIRRGERLGLVGESGCGKTTLARALLRLLSPNAVISSGQILLDGEDLLALSKEQMRKKRGKEIAFIPQNAMNALNPVHRIRDQLIELLYEHTSMPKKKALETIRAAIHSVDIHERHLNDYPHQLSGGMKQRIIIAMTLMLQPTLIIADEPTTALDVIVQQNILHKLRTMQEALNSALLFISHDLALVSSFCHTIVVMYGGKIMETCRMEQFLARASHPYSIGLQYASPNFSMNGEALITIPGMPPKLTELSKGCQFHERCPFVSDKCVSVEPKLQQIAEGHKVACHYVSEAQRFRREAKEIATWERRR
ncbi:hypothetical protein BEP19_11475 [Ammoniphilus oxalaticus]|uniref:Nickel import system ATP-binding protein NikD n=1 Tax=Ammoniphilus oxalaticus TaxID=66863 RepID=A0A419SGD8_9BACL|nr:ABC transporter ATP-binding protein [Ammoniphilus oxalaticus]RKD22854.1 hypothetical protein BEP19_11475 [Ammoniphilus oxalaticus]